MLYPVLWSGARCVSDARRFLSKYKTLYSQTTVSEIEGQLRYIDYLTFLAFCFHIYRVLCHQTSPIL